MERILLISDINWRTSIFDDGSSRERLLFFKKKIEEIAPSLVLIGGDLINDDNPPSFRFVKHLLKFFDFLNKKKTLCLIIEGNHDEYFYHMVKKGIADLSFVREISNQVIEHKGLRILGIPFSSTHKISDLKKIRERFPQQVDIILAHPEYSRRIFLFKLNANYIITGHYDRQLCQIQNKILIALNNFPTFYAILEYKEKEQFISYFGNKVKDLVLTNETCISQVKVVGNQLSWKYDDCSLSDSDYAKKTEELISAEKRFVVADIEEQKSIISELVGKGISKAHIGDYLRKRRLVYGYK